MGRVVHPPAMHLVIWRLRLMVRPAARQTSPVGASVISPLVGVHVHGAASGNRVIGTVQEADRMGTSDAA
jgi:hypothetical protein